MNKVKILVDSCSDLTKEIYEQNHMDVLSQNVSFGHTNYKDGVDISLEELYKNVEKTGELPHTAAVSPVEFEDYFKKAIDDGFDVVYVGLGSKLSTTFQNAHIAKQSFPEDRVFLVDSNSLSSGIGLVALKACKFRDEGLSASEIASKCQEIAKHVTAQFSVETLDYLHKGGRCSGVTKLIGHIFHVHPYLKVVDGSLIVYKNPRGPMRIAINEQINELKAVISKLDLDHVFITHAGVNQDIEDYAKAELSKIVPADKISITRAGCVIASHCGFGTIGILYITK